MPPALTRLASSRHEFSVKKHAEPLSKAAMDAFGWRGIIILGLLTGSVLLFGAFSVWFYTGVKTSSLVLCLVQLEQQEISAQLGNLVHEVAIQAAAIANLTLGSAALLPSPDASGFAISGSQFLPGGSVTPDSLLMHAVDAVQAMASGQASPFAVFIASLAAAHPGFRLHVAVGDGTYFGVMFNSLRPCSSTAGPPEDV